MPTQPVWRRKGISGLHVNRNVKLCNRNEGIYKLLDSTVSMYSDPLEFPLEHKIEEYEGTCIWTTHALHKYLNNACNIHVHLASYEYTYLLWHDET